MSQIKDRLENDIIVARRAQDKVKIEVLTFAKSRILEEEKIAFLQLRDPSSKELLNKRKLLELREEAAIIYNLIKSYKAEIEALKKRTWPSSKQFHGEKDSRENKIKLLEVYLSELRKDPDSLDTALLDLCIEFNITNRQEMQRAMPKITEILYFEDHRLIYDKLVDLLK